MNGREHTSPGHTIEKQPIPQHQKPLDFRVAKTAPQLTPSRSTFRLEAFTVRSAQ